MALCGLKIKWWYASAEVWSAGSRAGGANAVVPVHWGCLASVRNGVRHAAGMASAIDGCTHVNKLR